MTAKAQASDARKIADYLDRRAEQFDARKGDDARTRASALRVEASNIRAGLVED